MINKKTQLDINKHIKRVYISNIFNIFKVLRIKRLFLSKISTYVLFPEPYYKKFSKITDAYFLQCRSKKLLMRYDFSKNLQKIKNFLNYTGICVYNYIGDHYIYM